MSAPGWTRSWWPPVVAGAVLVGLMAVWTSERVHGPVGEPLVPYDDPGDDVLTLVTVDALLDDDRYRVREGSEHTVVLGSTQGLWVGRELTLGVDRVPGTQAVKEVWREPHDLRNGKKLLGLAAVGFFVVSGPLWLRRRDGWLVDRG